MKLNLSFLKFWILLTVLPIFRFDIYASATIAAKDNLIVNDSLSGLLSKGNQELKTKNYETAIVTYNEALKIATKNNLASDASFIYKKIGGIYYSKKEFDTSKIYYKRSLSIDSMSQNAADSHFNLVLIFRKQKEKDSLLFHLQKSLQLYNNLEDTEDKFNTFLKAGILLKNSGNYNTAIQYLLKAYDGFEELNNLEKKASVCNTIGAIQRLLGNLDIAKQYYLESLNIREELGDSIKLSYGYNNFGSLLKTQKKYDSAILFYSKAIRIQEGKEITKEHGKHYYNLGTAYYLKGKLKEAEKNYIKSIFYKKKEGDSLSLSSSYNGLAMVNNDNKEYLKSKKYLDSARKTLSVNQNRDILLRHYEIQSLYYKSLGDFEEALEYKEKYSSLYETLFQEKQAATIQELQERFESQKKLDRISQLTHNQNIQEGIISKQDDDIRLRNLLLTIAVVLLILAIALYFLIKQRQTVREKELELKRLESVFKNQEIIKERISKDLHDIVTTSYDGIRLKVLALSNTKNIGEISNKIVDEINSVNSEIRMISHRLSPLGDKIKEHPLRKIIVSQLTEFQYYRKIFIDIQLPLPIEIDQFKIESQTNLYGIILEALSNIEKHSQATEVVITHNKKGSNITLSISDNGVGIDQNRVDGIGLLNMKQRARLLDGRCDIESSEVGTKVSIHFPVNPNLK